MKKKKVTKKEKVKAKSKSSKTPISLSASELVQGGKDKPVQVTKKTPKNLVQGNWARYSNHNSDW